MNPFFTFLKASLNSLFSANSNKSIVISSFGLFGLFGFFFMTSLPFSSLFSNKYLAKVEDAVEETSKKTKKPKKAD